MFKYKNNVWNQCIRILHLTTCGSAKVTKSLTQLYVPLTSIQFGKLVSLSRMCIYKIKVCKRNSGYIDYNSSNTQGEKSESQYCIITVWMNLKWSNSIRAENYNSCINGRCGIPVDGREIRCLSILEVCSRQFILGSAVFMIPRQISVWRNTSSYQI